MKLAEAYPILKAACNVPFGELFKDHPEDLITNKGHVGQLLEEYIGLKLGNSLTDFEDGELKTNKTSPDGKPRETMFIRQIKSDFDTLVGRPRTQFEKSSVYNKIKNLLIVSVVKDAPMARDWYFLDVAHVNLARNRELHDQLSADYHIICDQFIEQIETGKDGLIHTSSGHYMQIRTKDSKNAKGKYIPIFSETYQRDISTKNHAFYFKKTYMRDILADKFD